jgi:hypothetical protein
MSFLAGNESRRQDGKKMYLVPVLFAESQTLETL